MGGSGVQSHYMILSCFREARLFYTSSENNYHNNKKLFWSRFSIEPHVRWPFWSQAFRENVLLPPFSGDSRDCDARPFGALAASVSRSCKKRYTEKTRVARNCFGWGCATRFSKLWPYFRPKYMIVQTFFRPLEAALIALCNPMTFRRGLFSFSICFEDECPWSMSK